jgi:hypothetical protein
MWWVLTELAEEPESGYIMGDNIFSFLTNVTVNITELGDVMLCSVLGFNRPCRGTRIRVDTGWLDDNGESVL